MSDQTTVLESMTTPFVDDDYDSRRGYDENFLGISLSPPRIADLSSIAEMVEGGHEIPYEHFSIVMHRHRRLALMTLSNVDAAPERKRPEPGFNYSRRGLSGLRPNDRERWLLDPRLEADHQLPDKFYTRDRGNFDKGHIVRRDDVAWGSSYEEVRRANGDTYHVTNCSPQVDAFNRSNLRGEWGRLENFVLGQATAERLCIFSGPVLDDANDKTFQGRDGQGDVAVQIPSQFWKVVVARHKNELQSFAFLLEQDLSEADVEFNTTAEWQSKMIRIADLQELLPDLLLPDSLLESDQAEAPTGAAILDRGGLEHFDS